MTKFPQSVTIIVEVIFMFNDFYEIYEKARAAPLKFLIDYHINRLPVELKVIIDMLGI